MKKHILLVVLCLTIVLSLICLSSCNKEKEIYLPTLIDNSREYVEETLTDQQKHISDKVEIKGYYTSGEYKIINVVSKEGYVGDIEMLVLINGTTVEKIMGVNIKESDEYGAKCFKEIFLSQFYNIDLKTMEPLLEKEDPYSDGDIMVVTHATTTSRAVIKAMNVTALFVQSL